MGFVAFVERTESNLRNSKRNGSVHFDGVRGSRLCVKYLEGAFLIVAQWIQEFAFAEKVEEMKRNDRAYIPKVCR